VTTQTNGKGHTKSTTTTAPANPGIDPSLPASTVPTQLAVLQAWNAGFQLIGNYAARSPGPVRADLIAHETIATIYPKVADYFVNPALNGEWTNLMNEKMGLFSTPVSGTTINQLQITALTSTTATLTFCISTTGTVTANGQPAPSSAGGGSYSVQSTSDLVLVAGSWKTASDPGAHKVTKC
jgi:hypothetical protein